MAKEGFKGQWVQICRTGLQTDNEGRKHNITSDFLKKVADNYNASTHESPAVVGHPKLNAPAFGWVTAMRVNGDSLEAQFGETDDEFEQMVRDGKFKKRSAAFYLDDKVVKQFPYLRHVGFLGATPPAIKGLRDIQFGEGESLTFEIQFNEGETMEEKDVDKVADSIYERLKSKLGFGTKEETQKPQSANFSEAEIQAMVKKAVEDATKAATTEFNEKLTAVENENKALRETVTNLSGSSKRAEIIAFAERLGAAKFPPAFKNMGVIEFMESLAESEAKVSVISFSEDGKEEKKECTQLEYFQNFLESMPSFIAFGEHFAGITATANADEFVDPNRMKKINAELGLDGGEK